MANRELQTQNGLYIYVIAVAVAWVAILGVMWFSDDMERLQKFSLVCSGFALGMIAMYIAVHLYRWK